MTTASRAPGIKLGVLLALALLCGGLWRWRLHGLPAADDGEVVMHGPGDSPAELAKPPLRVLFVGNNYTYVNDLPAMIRHLAAAGGNRLRFEGVQECPGGAYLRLHWESGRALQKLRASHFDWLVLQEQSEAPAQPPAVREAGVYPFVANFDAAARGVRTRTLLFMTWGHQAGDPANVPGDSYDAMQARLAAGYDGIARKLDVPVAPVGIAWREATRSRPSLNLWQADGSHPAVAGTYLAACVFYQIFYRRSPVGNGYTAGLDGATARALQEIAARIVSDYGRPPSDPRP